MSRTYFVAPVVEGLGEVQAVPILLRRLAGVINPAANLEINAPLRVKAGSFLNDPDYFRRYIELAARKAMQWPASRVLILLDCDDDCPARLGPLLLERAQACRADARQLVVLARREFETWFLYAAESLRGTCGLPPDLASPPAPEAIRNAKGWLADQMGVPYNEPNHQPRMTASFAIEQALKAPSFARLQRKLQEFLIS